MVVRMSGIVVTSALPYANGPIHIGHLVEYIQTDIFARFLKLTGKNAIYCCADDTHGTPIEIKASELGIKPEELIKKFSKEHQEDFRKFQIEFDSYYSTNSPENQKLSIEIFNKAKEAGHIYTKSIELTYCAHCKRFLPDRYVKGQCPKCRAEDQYGDQCEKCGTTYHTVDLKEPYCTICKKKPVRKSSTHYFFRLSAFSDKLKDYIEKSPFQKEVKNFILNWIKDGLKDWDISRDGPYFGFRIPGEENKYFYVWLDAPIGYISSTMNYCKKNNGNYEDYWKSKEGKIIHFIGKDIIYFHFLFWPAMLMASGYNLPSDMKVHGFLTVNGEKMSKSRGTFITAKEYIDSGLDPAYLRYYYAANLTHRLTDLDLSMDDFKDRINNELVANIGNFAYRVLSFINRNFGSRTGNFSEPDMEKQLMEKFREIKESYEKTNFREAISRILEVSAAGNKHFQENEPWKLIKEDKEKTKEILSLSVAILKNISILIDPVLPAISADLQKQLNLSNLDWNDLNFDLKNHEIGKAGILIKKIEKIPAGFAEKDMFGKIDLKVARVVDSKDHPDAEKLMILDIDLGKEKRQIVAGLKPHYSAEEMKGKKVIVVANLEPAKLRDVESEGMLLAVEGKKGKLGILVAEKSSPGDDVFAEGVEKEPAGKISFRDFGKLKIIAKNGAVSYKGKILKTKKEEIKTEKVEDGRVC